MKKYNRNLALLYSYVFSHAKRPPKLRELNREMKERVRILIIFVIGILLPTVSAAQTMTSENFTVQGGTFGSGGTEQVASSNFLLNFILGETIIGDGTGTNFQLQAGFENLISSITQALTPTPAGGGGDSGGVTTNITATDSSITISSNVTGQLTQNLTDSKIVTLDVPENSVVADTTFSVKEDVLSQRDVPQQTNPQGTLVIDTIFSITGVSEGTQVTTLAKSITTTITSPFIPDDTEIGVYILDTPAKLWRLVADVEIDGDSITFEMDQLGDYVIFAAEGPPETIPATFKIADADNNNTVDVVDFNLLLVDWQAPVPPERAGDFNNDDSVDIFDFNILMVHWE